MEQVAATPRTYQQKRDWDFRNLNIWKEGHAVVLRIFEMTKRWQRDETTDLAADLCHAAVGFTTTMARALVKNGHKEKIQGYESATIFIPELENLIMITRDLGYCTPSEADDIRYRAETLGKMTYGLIKASKIKMQQNQEK